MTSAAHDLLHIALVADMHGNLPATMALDQDLTARGIKHIYCLGDMIGKGPSSADTFDWAVARCEVILQGNWDSGIGMKQFPKDEFYYNQLGEKRMRMLCELPLEHTLTLSGRRIRLMHGRPIMKKLQLIQDEADTLAPLFDPDYNVVGYADAHRQGMRIVLNRGILLNTGSVGNGLGLNMVQYAILTGSKTRADAPFDVSFVTLPYDFERAAKDAREAKELPNALCFEREVLTGIYSRDPGTMLNKTRST